MENSSPIISALVSGIAQGATEMSIGAIPQAYTQLKVLLKNRYGIDLISFEQNSQLQSYQNDLNKKLLKVGASQDNDVIEAATSLARQLDDINQNSKSTYSPTTNILGSSNTVDNRQTIDTSQSIYNYASSNPLLIIIGLVILTLLGYFFLNFLGNGNTLPPKPPNFGVFVIGNNTYYETVTTKGNPDPNMNFPKVTDTQPSIALYLPQPGNYDMLMLHPLEHANEMLNNPHAVPYDLFVDENQVVVARLATPVIDGVYCFIQGDWLGVPNKLNRYCFEIDAS